MHYTGCQYLAGHLLYEMATGNELDTAIPESRHYLAVKNHDLLEVTDTHRIQHCFVIVTYALYWKIIVLIHFTALCMRCCDLYFLLTKGSCKISSIILLFCFKAFSVWK